MELKGPSPSCGPSVAIRSKAGLLGPSRYRKNPASSTELSSIAKETSQPAAAAERPEGAGGAGGAGEEGVVAQDPTQSRAVGLCQLCRHLAAPGDNWFHGHRVRRHPAVDANDVGKPDVALIIRRPDNEDMRAGGRRPFERGGIHVRRHVDRGRLSREEV